MKGAVRGLEELPHAITCNKQLHLVWSGNTVTKKLTRNWARFIASCAIIPVRFNAFSYVMINGDTSPQKWTDSPPYCGNFSPRCGNFFSPGTFQELL